jgi:hypothetical protein
MRAAIHMAILTAGVAATAAAQPTNVAAGAKRSWGENIGWMDWRDSGNPAGAQGARLSVTFLSGFIWCENVGYVHLGSGTPVGGSYANTTGTDFGVNRHAATGALTGLAWSENGGWINFGGGTLASPPRPARFDAAAQRLRGFAWAENLGWINLDDATSFVGFCPADFNTDGQVNVQDFLGFLAAYAVADPRCDFNDDGQITVQDFLAFLAGYAAGCP